MSLRWLLDTNTCIAVMNNRPETVRRKLTSQPVDTVGVSVITVYELEYGVQKSKQKARNRKTLDGFLYYVRVVPWDHGCAQQAAGVRSDLEQRGQLIGPYDILIAAHALDLSCTLVSHNTREYRRVQDLTVADWIK